LVTGEVREIQLKKKEKIVSKKRNQEKDTLHLCFDENYSPLRIKRKKYAGSHRNRLGRKERESLSFKYVSLKTQRCRTHSGKSQPQMRAPRRKVWSGRGIENQRKIGSRRTRRRRQAFSVLNRRKEAREFRAKTKKRRAIGFKGVRLCEIPLKRDQMPKVPNLSHQEKSPAEIDNKKQKKGEIP